MLLLRKIVNVTIIINVSEDYQFFRDKYEFDLGGLYTIMAFIAIPSASLYMALHSEQNRICV